MGDLLSQIKTCHLKNVLGTAWVPQSTLEGTSLE